MFSQAGNTIYDDTRSAKPAWPPDRYLDPELFRLPPKDEASRRISRFRVMDIATGFNHVIRYEVAGETVIPHTDESKVTSLDQFLIDPQGIQLRAFSFELCSRFGVNPPENHPCLSMHDLWIRTNEPSPLQRVLLHYNVPSSVWRRIHLFRTEKGMDVLRASGPLISENRPSICDILYGLPAMDHSRHGHHLVYSCYNFQSLFHVIFIFRIAGLDYNELFSRPIHFAARETPRSLLVGNPFAIHTLLLSTLRNPSRQHLPNTSFFNFWAGRNDAKTQVVNSSELKTPLWLLRPRIYTHKILQELLEKMRHHNDVIEQSLQHRGIISDQLEDLLQFVRARKEVLEWWKERLEQLSTEYSEILTRKSNGINLQIAKQGVADAVSMRTLAIVSLIYVPGAYMSSFFSMTFLQDVLNHTELLWLYFVVTIPLTVMTVAIWWGYQHSVVQKEDNRRKTFRDSTFNLWDQVDSEVENSEHDHFVQFNFRSPLSRTHST